MTVVVGLIVTALSLGVAFEVQRSEKNIIDMMAPAFNMFLGPLASLFLIGMFLSCRTHTVIFAASCSLVISFIWSYWKILFGTPWEPSITLTTAVPYLSGFVIAAIVSFIANDRADDPGRDYMWRAVMRRPVPEASDAPHGN